MMSSNLWHASVRQWRTACQNVVNALDMRRQSAIWFIQEWVNFTTDEQNGHSAMYGLHDRLERQWTYALASSELPDLFDAFGVKPKNYDVLLNRLNLEITMPEGLRLAFRDCYEIPMPQKIVGLVIEYSPAETASSA